MFKDLNKIMKQAQELQKNLQRAQEELAQLQVTGEVAGGAVKITMTGKYDVIEVKIDSSLLNPDSLDMIGELVEAALRNALEKIKAATEEKLGSFRALGTDISGIF